MFIFTFFVEVAAAAAVAVGFLAAGHYAPWHQWLGRSLDRWEAYVYGTLCLLVPVSGAALLGGWPGAQVVAACWAVAATGGLTVIGLYALDNGHAKKLARREQDELERLRKGGK